MPPHAPFPAPPSSAQTGSTVSVEGAAAPQGRAVAFLLTEGMSMIAFAAALEPLRIANRLSGRTVYRWRLASEEGARRTCSNGVPIAAEVGLEETPRDGMIFVCGGLGVQAAATKPVLTWLRKESRRGIALGGICTGAHVLARAGLLDGRRCTLHWENQPAFREEFPEIEVTNHLYEISNGRCTCAGGTAAADMMLHFVAEDCGAEIASLTADQLIHAPVRALGEEQRISVPARIGVRHPKLVSIIQVMEGNLEEPISPSQLAKDAGMSTRQLERLFRRYLNRSPKRYYMELRLERARRLLLQTDMSVINVALACGFTSPSHFSKCYRSFFDRTPYRERGAPSGKRVDGVAEDGPEDEIFDALDELS